MINFIFSFMSDIQPILDKVLSGETNDRRRLHALLESYDIAQIGAAAHEIRMRKNRSETS